jgi:hypothetical protein
VAEDGTWLGKCALELVDRHAKLPRHKLHGLAAKQAQHDLPLSRHAPALARRQRPDRRRVRRHTRQTRGQHGRALPALADHRRSINISAFDFSSSPRSPLGQTAVQRNQGQLSRYLDSWDRRVRHSPPTFETYPRGVLAKTVSCARLLTPPAAAMITILKWANCGGGGGGGSGTLLVVISKEALVEEALVIVSD